MKQKAQNSIQMCVQKTDHIKNVSILYAFM